jgi:hypothetical protein
MTDPPATLAAALAELQTQLPKIGKTAEAQYGKYADLADVNHAILPLMGALGLSFSAKLTTRKGQFGLRYKFRLAGSDETDKGFIPLTATTPQQVGSATTYFRRYVLGAWTGAAPVGEDDDGQAAGPVPSREENGSGGRWMNRRPDLPPAHLRDKITPGPRPGPELEQLRDGTVEASPDDRPARRVKGQDPDGGPWLDQPPGRFDETPPEERHSSIDGRQRSIIMAHLGKLRREERLGKLAGLAGREVESTNDLSWVEADKVIKAIEAEQKAAEQDAAAEVAP